MEELIDHIVTQDDLDLNTDWVEDGIKVGEIVQLSKEDHEDLLSLVAQETTEPVVEELIVIETKTNKTIVPSWARVGGEDASEAIENDLVVPVVEKEVISKEDTPEWAKGEVK